MIEIDYGQLVYIRLNDRKWLSKVKAQLISYGFAEKQIVNEDAVKFAQIGDYVAYVNDLRDPPQLIIEKVKETKDKHPNIQDYHLITCETMYEVDLT